MDLLLCPTGAPRGTMSGMSRKIPHRPEQDQRQMLATARTSAFGGQQANPYAELDQAELRPHAAASFACGAAWAMNVFVEVFGRKFTLVEREIAEVGAGGIVPDTRGLESPF